MFGGSGVESFEDLFPTKIRSDRIPFICFDGDSIAIPLEFGCKSIGITIAIYYRLVSNRIYEKSANRLNRY